MKTTCLSCVLAGFVLLTGCADKLAHITGADAGATVLKGNNAAIGGVNYSGVASSKEPEWDRHVTGCRHSAEHGYTFSGDGADLFGFNPSGEEPRTTLHGPAGVVRFASSECSGTKLTLTRPGDASEGKLALVCEANSHQMTASVRFERCGA